ncbi:MAG: FtsX-like permease family protein [Chloroflexi bacterium]|nr:MAG: FtsX-like permease family protein [Chloroflexota bacterium]
MNALLFFTRTAWRSLIRGGQRTFVALLCIAFGVMSLVAMTYLAESLNRAIVVDPAEQFGGDISLSRKTEDIISPVHIEELDVLVQTGEIDRYTQIAFTSSLTLRTPGSGELHFLAAGMGIEPDQYPLAGRLSLIEPGNVGLTTLLLNPGDIVITRDIVHEYGLQLGDEVILADIQTGIPVHGIVRGIAGDTPNHQGSKVYYTIETAELLENGHPAVNTVLVNSQNSEELAAKLDESGWWATSSQMSAARNESEKDLFDTLFKGAGILGLMVGGIGIANTMQVLLRRRQKEMAIWKALGYQEMQLQALFAGEAAMLGAFGSLLGVILGLAVSVGLVHLFSRTTNLLISWSFSASSLVGGWFVGILTTIIFAMWSIISASRARPMSLLRNEPVNVENMPKIKRLLLIILLALPFTLITSLIMGSIIKGIGVLVFALAGLIVLGSGLGGLAWITTRILPLRVLPFARIAQSSLRRRGWNLVFAMIALFTGIVSIALGVVFTQNAQSAMSNRTVEIEGYNIQVIAPFGQENEVKAAVEGQQIQEFAYSYQTAVENIRGSGPETDGIASQPLLIGRSEPGEFQLSGASWGSQPEGVYTYAPSSIPAGSQVEVTLMGGTTRTLGVIGTYDIDWDASLLPPETGLLMSAEMSASLAQPDTVTYYVKAPRGEISRVSDALGNALPDGTIINLAAYAARYTQTYHNLFVLALAMAGLALLAGVLLVANSVSLAMLDRRYEIGVLKAIGYSRVHVLAALAVEYGLVALIASVAGIAAVQVFLWILGILNDLAGSLLNMEPLSAVLILFLGVSLILTTVFAVSSGSIRQSPASVLNEHG